MNSLNVRIVRRICDVSFSRCLLSELMVSTTVCIIESCVIIYLSMERREIGMGTPLVKTANIVFAFVLDALYQNWVRHDVYVYGIGVCSFFPHNSPALLSATLSDFNYWEKPQKSINECIQPPNNNNETHCKWERRKKWGKNQAWWSTGWKQVSWENVWYYGWNRMFVTDNNVRLWKQISVRWRKCCECHGIDGKKSMGARDREREGGRKREREIERLGNEKKYEILARNVNKRRNEK